MKHLGFCWKSNNVKDSTPDSGDVAVEKRLSGNIPGVVGAASEKMLLKTGESRFSLWKAIAQQLRQPLANMPTSRHWASKCHSPAKQLA